MIRRGLFSRVHFGGDYNPEQWDPSVWREDARLMRDAGVDLVTVGVFSWASVERREGLFDFAWLDEALSLLHGAGVQVDLATGTASPPNWACAAYPDILPVDAGGARYSPGKPAAFQRQLRILPQAGRGVRPQARRTLSRPPGRRPLARQQRVRVPCAV